MSLFVQNCVTTATIALLVYDYVLTLGSEVEFYWCQRGAPVNKAMFFLLRISILGTVITSVLEAYALTLQMTLGG